MYEDIAKALASDVKKYGLLGMFNYVTAYTVLFIALVGSAGGVITALKLPSHPILTAILAALPGLALVVNQSFVFDLRAAWHLEKKRRLAALLRLVQVGAVERRDAAVEWNKLDAAMDAKWPGFGRLPRSVAPDSDASKS